MTSATATNASEPDDHCREDPIEKLKRTPTKSILKPTGSRTENDERNISTSKSTKWDEMNILNTLHPIDKDYGYMKIGEPKTPYEREIDEYDNEMNVGVNADELKKRIQDVQSSSFQSTSFEYGSSEKKLTRDVFEEKRKIHYNEFQTAKELKEQNMTDEDDDDYHEKYKF